jgi:hypothetical protein
LSLSRAINFKHTYNQIIKAGEDVSVCVYGERNSNAYVRAEAVNVANKIGPEKETTVFITANNA